MVGTMAMATAFKKTYSSMLGLPGLLHSVSLTPHSRLLLNNISARNSQAYTGKSGSVSCGITAPFSWVLVHTRFCLCPPRVCFLVLCKVWQLCGGVNGDLLQEGLCHTQVCCTQSPCPCDNLLLISTPTGAVIKHSSVSVSVGSLKKQSGNIQP